jgi:hypothetical protein
VITTYRAAPDIDVVSSTAAIPGFGSLAINAFVMHGDEPLLVAVNVRQAKELMLEVLFGSTGDVQAHVNWVDARLVE